MGSHARRLLVPLVALPLLANISCAGRQVQMSQKGMTCTEAENVAIAAVKKMGYHIKETTKPSASAPGKVQGEREIATGNVHRVLVLVACTPLGAEVEAKVEAGPLDEPNFAKEFKDSFNAAAEVRRPAREAAPNAVDVLVVPERAAGGDLGVDLSETGLMPVFLRITNHSPRRYGFKVSKVLLQQTGGGRIHALSAAEVAAKAPPALIETLRAKLVKEGDLKPGEALSGYLFFPFGGYSNARVTLEDIESKEDEGFFIEF